jgi:hypothetical protein
MYKKELIIKLYSEELYNALCKIEEQRRIEELRRNRKLKLQKLNNINHDKI